MFYHLFCVRWDFLSVRLIFLSLSLSLFKMNDTLPSYTHHILMGFSLCYCKSMLRGAFQTFLMFLGRTKNLLNLAFGVEFSRKQSITLLSLFVVSFIFGFTDSSPGRFKHKCSCLRFTEYNINDIETLVE